MSDEITKSKHPGGRPTVWTKEVEGILFEAIRDGMPFKGSCALAGVSDQAFWDRMRDDQEFSGRVRRDEQAATWLHLRKLNHAQELPAGTASAAVAASKFYLATRGGGEFRESTKVEHSGTIAVNLTDLVAKCAKPKDESEAGG